MTVESPFSGHSDWRLPSPSSTPNATGPKTPTSKTPRAAGSPSYFVDAFATPRPNGHRTPAQTPVFNTFTVVERPASPRGSKVPEPWDPEFHVNHPLDTPYLELPPVSPGRRLSSSPYSSSFPTQPHDSSRNSSKTHVSNRDPMDSFQMQTPPPTRDASSRRKMPPPQPHITGTPANITPRPLQTTPVMQAPPSLNIQTPFQFNSLQFSPEAFQFHGRGPASAPVYPPSRPFWDPNSPQGMNMDISPSHDPFASGAQQQAIGPVWPSFQHQARMEQQMSQQMSQAQQQPQVMQQQQSMPNFWSPGDVISNVPGSFSSPIHPSALSGVEPHMLLSFSSPTQPSTMIQPHQTQIDRTQNVRQPYEHQAKESQRENELARTARQQHVRTNTNASAASSGLSAKPILQRSNTDSGFRKKPNSSVDSRLSTQSNEEENILRKASPLKRLSQQSQAALSAIPEASRTKARTRLVIDEYGNARTETVLPDGESESRRRSGLWVDSDSDSESKEDETIASRRSSFIFSTDTLRRSKHARIDSSADLGKVARSSSSSSLSNIASSIKRSTSASSRRANSKRDPRRFSGASFGSSTLQSESADRSWDMEGVEDGDAQLALKKVIEDKLKRQEQSPEEKLKAHNQRWSLASADVTKLQPFSFDAPMSQTSSHNLPLTTHSNMRQHISPANLSVFDDGTFATPGTDRTPLSQISIRCTCQNNVDDGTSMVQCESCQNLLHANCAFSNQPVPQVFVCSFCTGFTPLARGGRIREPIRNAPLPNQTFASPLAGKGKPSFR